MKVKAYLEIDPDKYNDLLVGETLTIIRAIRIGYALKFRNIKLTGTREHIPTTNMILLRLDKALGKNNQATRTYQQIKEAYLKDIKETWRQLYYYRKATNGFMVGKYYSDGFFDVVHCYKEYQKAIDGVRRSIHVHKATKVFQDYAGKRINRKLAGMRAWLNSAYALISENRFADFLRHIERYQHIEWMIEDLEKYAESVFK